MEGLPVLTEDEIRNETEGYQQLQFLLSSLRSNLRGAYQIRRLEEEQKWRQQGGYYGGDDYSMNQYSNNYSSYSNNNYSGSGSGSGSSSSYNGNSYYNGSGYNGSSSSGSSSYSTPTSSTSREATFEKITNYLGVGLLVVAVAACLSIACAVRRKTKNAEAASKEIDPGSRLTQGRGRTTGPRGRSESRARSATRGRSSSVPRISIEERGRSSSRPRYSEERGRSPFRPVPVLNDEIMSGEYGLLDDDAEDIENPRTRSTSRHKGRERELERQQRPRAPSRPRSVRRH